MLLNAWKVLILQWVLILLDFRLFLKTNIIESSMYNSITLLKTPQVVGPTTVLHIWGLKWRRLYKKYKPHITLWQKTVESGAQEGESYSKSEMHGWTMNTL